MPAIHFWMDRLVFPSWRTLLKAVDKVDTGYSKALALCTLTNRSVLVGRHNGMYMYTNQIMPTHSIPLNTYYRFCCAYKSYIVLL